MDLAGLVPRAVSAKKNRGEKKKGPYIKKKDLCSLVLENWKRGRLG